MTNPVSGFSASAVSFGRTTPPLTQSITFGKESNAETEETEPGKSETRTTVETRNDGDSSLSLRGVHREIFSPVADWIGPNGIGPL